MTDTPETTPTPENSAGETSSTASDTSAAAPTAAPATPSTTNGTRNSIIAAIVVGALLLGGILGGVVVKVFDDDDHGRMTISRNGQMPPLGKDGEMGPKRGEQNDKSYGGRHRDNDDRYQMPGGRMPNEQMPGMPSDQNRNSVPPSNSQPSMN